MGAPADSRTRGCFVLTDQGARPEPFEEISLGELLTVLPFE
jgi:hypothetical protein